MIKEILSITIIIRNNIFCIERNETMRVLKKEIFQAVFVKIYKYPRPERSMKIISFNENEFLEKLSLGNYYYEREGSIIHFICMLDLTEHAISNPLRAKIEKEKEALLGLLSNYKEKISKNEIKKELDKAAEFIKKLYTLAIEQRKYDKYLEYKNKEKDKYNKKILYIAEHFLAQ